MFLWDSLTIRKKLTIGNVATTLLVTLILVVISAWKLTTSSNDDLRLSSRVGTLLTAEAVKGSVQFEDVGVIDMQLDQLIRANPDVSMAAVVVLDPAAGGLKIMAQKKQIGKKSWMQPRSRRICWPNLQKERPFSTFPCKVMRGSRSGCPTRARKPMSSWPPTRSGWVPRSGAAWGSWLWSAYACWG